MQLIKKQEGYALLVVLLMVVLFLGLSAVFMAGAINNANQEQTVDASNQSVASAEMGVRYYSADFQREVSQIKSEIIEMTQNRIKSIVDCFNSGNSSCDEQSELTAMEQQIDIDMKAEYISRVTAKVSELETLKDIQNTPFPDEDAHYAIEGTSIMQLNEVEKDVSLASTPDKIVRWLKVELNLSGESRGTTKYLTGIFTVEVPDTFLSPSESLTIETKTVNDQVLNYNDMFSQLWPTKKCAALKAEINSGVFSSPRECILDSSLSASEFVTFLSEKNLNPKDFKIFTNNFKADICDNSCNNIKPLGSITIVAKSDDDGLFGNGGKNLNSFDSLNLQIDGHFDPKNMNSLGKHGESQTLIFRELTVSNNMQGGGITNTNLLILGKEIPKVVGKPDSIMDFQGNLTIGDNGRICFDLTRISPKDVDNLARKASFSNKNTTGQIIYYTDSLVNNKFFLKDGAYKEDKDRTIPYVFGYDNYTNFLSSCGIDVTNIITEITDAPYAYIVEPSFSMDVEY